MFGTIPAKGFYIRHAKEISFSDIFFHYENDDTRELFVTDDAEGIRYNGIFVNGTENK
jgi:hypothetical protein